MRILKKIQNPKNQNLIQKIVKNQMMILKKIYNQKNPKKVKNMMILKKILNLKSWKIVRIRKKQM